MKKGQVAVIGFVVTVVLIIVVFQLFSDQISAWFGGEETYEELNEDANRIGDTLLSEGYPIHWNELNVKKVGLIDGEVLSMRSLERFSKIDYEKSKLYLGINNDYMFFIEKDSLDVATVNKTKVIVTDPINKDFFGWNGYIDSYQGNGGLPFGFFYNQIHEQAKNIAKSERFVYLEDGINNKTSAKLIIYTWDPLDLAYNNTECSDGINNDPWEDNWVDYSPSPSGVFGDPGCESFADDNESDGFTDLECSFKNICAYDEEPIIGIMLNPGSGGHASINGSSEPTKICCANKAHFDVEISSTCDLDPGNIFIARLESEVNSHIQKNISGPYPNKLCIHGVGRNLLCAYESECTDGRECLFSFQDSLGGHIGGCPGDMGIEIFSEKVCCKFET
jgi:hypothetical protein